MRVRLQFAIVILALVFAQPFISYAASDLNVVINGEQLTGGTCTGGNCELTLTGLHAGVEFINNNGTAKVKATEGDPETLRLENVTIKALQATEHVMTFYATFVQPPTADPTTNKKVKYDRTADGNMKRGASAPRNDKFTINGWVDDLADSSLEFKVEPTQYKLVTCPPVPPACSASYGNFSFSTYLEKTTGFSGNRVGKIEIKFDAKYVNDLLNVTLVELKGSTSAGGVDGSMIGVYDSYSEEHIIQREEEKEMENDRRKSKKERPKDHEVN